MHSGLSIKVYFIRLQNGLGISGGVIHGQALDQLCLCVQQGAVLVQLLGVASLLCAFRAANTGWFTFSSSTLSLFTPSLPGCLDSTFSISMDSGPSALRQTGDPSGEWRP